MSLPTTVISGYGYIGACYADTPNTGDLPDPRCAATIVGGGCAVRSLDAGIAICNSLSQCTSIVCWNKQAFPTSTDCYLFSNPLTLPQPQLTNGFPQQIGWVKYGVTATVRGSPTVIPFPPPPPAPIPPPRPSPSPSPSPSPRPQQPSSNPPPEDPSPSDASPPPQPDQTSTDQASTTTSGESTRSTTLSTLPNSLPSPFPIDVPTFIPTDMPTDPPSLLNPTSVPTIPSLPSSTPSTSSSSTTPIIAWLHHRHDGFATKPSPPTPVVVPLVPPPRRVIVERGDVYVGEKGVGNSAYPGTNLIERNAGTGSYMGSSKSLEAHAGSFVNAGHQGYNGHAYAGDNMYTSNNVSRPTLYPNEKTATPLELGASSSLQKSMVVVENREEKVMWNGAGAGAANQQPSSSRRPPLRAVSNLQREEALFSSSPAKSAQAGQSSPRLNIAPSSDAPVRMQDLGSPLHYPTSSPHHRRRTPQRAPASIDPLFSQSSAGQPPFSAPRFRRGDVTPSSHPQGVENRTVIWGTTVNIQEAMASFKRFIMNFTVEFKIQKLREMNAEEGELTAEELLFREKTVTEQDSRPFYPDLLHQMRAADRTSMNLDCLNLKIFPASVKLYYQLIRGLGDGVMMTVRPFNANRMTNMRDLDPADIDQLVTIKGLMIRCSPVIPDLKEAFFRCAVCDQTATADIDRGRIIEPTLCPRDECKSKNTMVLIHNRCVFADKQICKMQETPDETPDGQTPYTVSLCTYDDLVDVAKPGDRVEVTGIFRAIPVRVNPRQRTIKSLFRTYVDIVHIKKTDFRRLTVDKSILNENEFETNFEEGDRMHFDDADEERILELSRRLNLYNLLSRSVGEVCFTFNELGKRVAKDYFILPAPSIFGMEDVKKGVLLQLFGGTNKFQGGSAGSPRIR
ncbi:hypothetical protein BC829DRAFT_494347 [Chytridium lagenaria]|nr:hypothetical protein BC829DRAFT_494347 [Chytridium lagenaria]